MRLDKYLAEIHKEFSRSKIQKAIHEGLVLVNGQKIVEPDFEVSELDMISLPDLTEPAFDLSDIELKIVFENEDLAVIDKPAGLVVHPGAGNTKDTLANALLKYFPQIKEVGEPHRPGIVHRLDEDTSGLIVVAKTAAAFDYLKKTFLDREIEKEYLALVHGILEQKHGIIDLPLLKDPKKQKVKVSDEGKEARTEYWVMGGNGGKGENGEAGRAGQFSLLRVKLHTGRTHQIRVHMQAIGHPLAGDQVYAGLFKEADKQLVDRQFLHAYRLKFKLMDGTWIELTSPLPQDLRSVLSKLGINYDDPKF